jgi:hypothetical protein
MAMLRGTEQHPASASFERATGPHPVTPAARGHAGAGADTALPPAPALFRRMQAGPQGGPAPPAIPPLPQCAFGPHLEWEVVFRFERFEVCGA